MSKVVYFVIGAVSAVLLIPCLLVIFMALPDSFEGDKGALLLLIGALIIGSIALFSLISSRKKWQKLTVIEQENIILQRVQGRGGLITATELASETNMTLTEAADTLDALFVRGICEKRVTDSAVNVYEFPGVMTRNEKAASRNIMDFLPE